MNTLAGFTQMSGQDPVILLSGSSAKNSEYDISGAAAFFRMQLLFFALFPTGMVKVARSALLSLTEQDFFVCCMCFDYTYFSAFT